MKSSHLKCLYIHDHKFKKVGNYFFSEGKITNDILLRYITDDDDLVVLSRLEIKNDDDGLVEITLPNVSFLPLKGVVFSEIFSAFLLKNTRIVLRAMKKSDFLVIRLPSFIGVFVLLVNIAIKKKYFIEVVGDAEESLLSISNNQNFIYKFLVSLFAETNKFFIKRADGVIYVTKFALQKKYSTQGFSSYASNVELKFKPRNIIFSNYEISNICFKIGLIGSFNNHYKGINEAVNAIKILKDNEKKVELHILGSGSLKSHYESLAKELGVNDLVFFDGVLKGGDEVTKWLNSLDLYVQPSYTEGLPRALIEAMSVGLPAIATDVGGIPELLPKDTLIKSYDAIALAEKINKYVDSQQMRFEQGKLNYQKSKEYDPSVLKQRRSEFWKAARDIVKRSLV